MINLVLTFSLILGLGAALGLAASAWQASKKQALGSVDAGLAALVGSLLGGRAAHIAAYWGYYQSRPAEIPQPWLGGLSASGALLGAALGLLVFSAFTRRRPGELADGLLPLLACMVTSAWLACWLDGTAYGPGASGWWGLPSQDEWGQVSKRLPLQLIGALLALAWFWLLDRLRLPKSAPAGRLAGLAYLGVALELFGLSFFRADPGPTWRALRLDAWGSLAAAGLALLWLWFTFIQTKRFAHD